MQGREQSALEAELMDLKPQLQQLEGQRLALATSKADLEEQLGAAQTAEAVRSEEWYVFCSNITEIIVNAVLVDSS